MNWTMGRYIDSLDVEGRDRLIGAPEFNNGREWWTNGCGCLVGTVARGCPSGAELSRFHHAAARTTRKARLGDTILGSISWAMGPASVRYPQAVTRFGKSRVVRAIKLRAARLNGCDPETIAALTNAKSEQPA